ncbi:glutathione S-transferase [Myriangium duriaei CBS 260.36]|uniref:Glutathione S-transferase n=1 Tax=Myriangium duriaei CBS 260.36 TaxID=1168546 RepID=A0A9P4IWZ8_9PEZI|nr:glutathione S-transferase [Myriangium duriaei CBS 260.36]
MLTVHHLRVSQSERVVYLCEELGIPYDLRLHKRNPIFSPPELYELHPLGAAPIIQDGGDLTLAESVACVEYICHVHGGGRLYKKPGEKGYADFLYWLHFANGTLQPGMSRLNVLRAAKAAPDSDGFKFAQRRQEGYFKHLDDRLGKVEWLAGEEFTAADVMVLFTLTTMRTLVPFDLSGYKNILAYVKRCSEREAYRRYKEKADPDVPEEVFGGPAPKHFFEWRKH